MKDIKDYLHLYLGCKIMCVVGSADNEYNGQIENNSALLLDKHSNGNWKLILRPLLDMSEEEHEAYDTHYMALEHLREEDHHLLCDAEIQAEMTRWLISLGIDMFGLIEAGLAIDKTTTSSPSKEQQ